MTLFARNNDFFADDEVGAYVAFIAIAKKKGGKPIKFVLYRFLSIGPQGIFESVEFSGHQEKEAKEAFPFGPILYLPIEEESEGMRDLIKNQKFVGTRIDPWRKTTDWLSDVAVGGSRYPKGVWVKIGRPNSWRQRRARRKKRLRFGEYGHILAKRRLELKEMDEELSFIKSRHLNEKSWAKKQEELDSTKAKVDGLLAEMKYVRDQKSHSSSTARYSPTLPFRPF